MTSVILLHMKTAISLPDELFERAETLAQRLGLARSQLYTRALREFLDRHLDANVTAQLDAIYSDEDSTLDPAVAALQSAALTESD